MGPSLLGNSDDAIVGWAGPCVCYKMGVNVPAHFQKWWVWSKGPFVVCPTPLPVRTANTGPRPAPGLTSAPRDQICLLRPSAAAAARTGGSSPSRRDRDEHGHHRVDDAGVPGGGPEPGLHQSGRQLLGARLRPPHHHLRRLHHRRLPLWCAPFLYFAPTPFLSARSLWEAQTRGPCAGIKPGIRGPSMVTGGLIGVMGGFMYAYQNSAGRLMGFFPNEAEVARFKNRLP
jgi:hypothetical protein